MLVVVLLGAQSIFRCTRTAENRRNPFFVRAFLKSLYEEELLRFEGGVGWTWEISEIRRRPPTANVVDLMICPE